MDGASTLDKPATSFATKNDQPDERRTYKLLR